MSNNNANSSMQDKLLPKGFDHRGAETILVVDDDSALRTVFEMVLRHFGYTVIVADNGQDGIDKFRENRNSINFVIMDVMMPIKNGRDCYLEIKQLHPAIKVLFLTGYAGEAIKVLKEFDDTIEIMMKPVKPFDLLAKMRSLLDME